jgi:GLPGLI family protein
MKTKLLLLVSILGITVGSAQEFQGKAEYFSKLVIKSDITVGNDAVKESLGPEIEQSIKDALKSATEKQYTLTFNRVEAVYEENQQLEKPSGASGGFGISISIPGGGKKYLNLKNKEILEEEDIFGKEFLISEPLTQLNWKLGTETKKIGVYTCIKAELVIPVTDQERKDYADFLEREKTKPSVFKLPEPKDRTVIAWYTPEIPVSFGPKNYWGLPGLILEIQEEDLVILCQKVTLNSKENFKIKAPSKGDKVSRKKFEEIQKKKIESMQDSDGNVIFMSGN